MVVRQGQPKAVTSSMLSHAMAGITIPDATVEGTDTGEYWTPDGGPWCPTCRGARWMKRPDFDPRYHRIEEALMRCGGCLDVQRTANRNRLARLAGLGEEERGKTFSRLKPVRGMSEAVKAAADWAKYPDGWLVIYGAPGSGKTHLALAVTNALIHSEQRVVWRYVPTLIRDLRVQAGCQEPDAITPLLTDAPVLVLDDLGAARWTDYVAETMELVFGQRYGRRMPTLVTLIGDPEEMSKPGYDLAESVKRSLSVSIGRRMQDRAVCRVVWNAAPQYGRPA